MNIRIFSCLNRSNGITTFNSQRKKKHQTLENDQMASWNLHKPFMTSNAAASALSGSQCSVLRLLCHPLSYTPMVFYQVCQYVRCIFMQIVTAYSPYVALHNLSPLCSRCIYGCMYITPTKKNLLESKVCFINKKTINNKLCIYFYLKKSLRGKKNCIHRKVIWFLITILIQI